MKHNKTDLLQMQSLPLSAKIRMSERRIRDWYDYWNGYVYVSFSGGKDSTVLKHLVETTIGQLYNPDTDLSEHVPSLFINTGLEYPEIQRFAMAQSNVVTIRPEMRFDQVIKKYGYPVVSKEIAQVIEEARRHATTGKYTYRIKRLEGTLLTKDGKKSAYNCPQYKYLLDAPFKISSKCCDVMKKKPAKSYEKETGRKAFIGTLAQESRARQTAWFINGCNSFNKNRPTSQPLSFWTEQDILMYIVLYKLRVSPVYSQIKGVYKGCELPQHSIRRMLKVNPDLEKDIKLYTTGARRTGCIFCMFGMKQDGCPNRFEKLRESHPNQYNYCMKPLDKGGLGLAEVLDFIGEAY